MEITLSEVPDTAFNLKKHNICLNLTDKIFTNFELDFIYFSPFSGLFVILPQPSINALKTEPVSALNPG